MASDMFVNFARNATERESAFIDTLLSLRHHLGIEKRSQLYRMGKGILELHKDFEEDLMQAAITGRARLPLPPEPSNY